MTMSWPLAETWAQPCQALRRWIQGQLAAHLGLTMMEKDSEIAEYLGWELRSRSWMTRQWRLWWEEQMDCRRYHRLAEF